MENCSGVKRIQGWREIFIFVIKIYTFLTPSFEHDFPCNRITLRARKALRVMWNTMMGRRALPGAGAPGRAAKMHEKVELHVPNPKISSFSSFTKMSKFCENLDFGGKVSPLWAGHSPSQGIARQRRLECTYLMPQNLTENYS